MTIHGARPGCFADVRVLDLTQFEALLAAAPGVKIVFLRPQRSDAVA